jgi:hypothetical protein
MAAQATAESRLAARSDSRTARFLAALKGDVGQERDDIEQVLFDECKAMIRYASGSGLTIPPLAVTAVKAATKAEREAAKAEAKDALPEYNVKQLVDAHKFLARTIAPATPRTLRMLEEEMPTRGITRLLGPIKLVRQLMVFAIVALIGFILLISLTPVASQTATSDLIGPTGASVRSAAADIGATALTKAFYLLSAAGMGAAFAALFRANRYIAAGCFDRKYEASYWITVVLGLIAGIVLAQILPDGSTGLTKLGKPLLALLGGFSAPAVYQVLQRMVHTVQALIEGDGQAMLQAQQEATKLAMASDALQGQVALVKKAVEAQKELYKQNIPDKNKEAIAKLFADLLDAGTGEISGT